MQTIKKYGQITTNFWRSEFACRCGCGLDTIDECLVHRIQVLRDYINKTITILSGCRCEAHNTKIGGEPGSYHLKGLACDFELEDLSRISLVGSFQKTWSGGFHYYPEQKFIHVDIRGKRARW